MRANIRNSLEHENIVELEKKFIHEMTIERFLDYIVENGLPIEEYSETIIDNMATIFSNYFILGKDSLARASLLAKG